MSNSTSIGRGPAHGSNENHDGDPTHTTLGEGGSQEEAPAGSDVLDRAVPGIPVGVKGELEAAPGPQPKQEK